jgi:hypothetical protein
MNRARYILSLLSEAEAVKAVEKVAEPGGVWDTATDIYHRTGSALHGIGHGLGHVANAIGDTAHQYPGITGVAALGAGAYAIHRHRKKKAEGGGLY